MAKGLGSSVGKGFGGGMGGTGSGKRGPGHTKPLFSKPSGPGPGPKRDAPVKEPRPGGEKHFEPGKQVGMEGGTKDYQPDRQAAGTGPARRFSCLGCGCALPALAAVVTALVLAVSAF